MADSIFAGLEAFGLGGNEKLNLFEEEKNDKTVKPVEEKKVVRLHEKDFLFDKTITCPCCDLQFKTRTLKSSGARLIGTDKDLRPRHDGIDVTKYDAIVCPKCGYAALSRYFPTVMPSQRAAIKDKISKNFKTRPGEPETLTYDEAIEIYKIALLNAVVKGAKASEKAYICLKISWLYRGKAEEMEFEDEEYTKAKENELEFTKNAFEGFVAAVQKESFPMCGMDESTVDYLLASLGLMTNHIDVSSRMIGKILSSNTANSRLKDRARDLKDEILKKYNAKK